MKALTEAQRKRYARHLVLPDFGVEGQQKLLEAAVLVIGAGGLGSPAAYYLAAAGVGTIGIADADVVDISNLQRQIIHFTDDLDLLKVDSAARKMRAINPDITVKTYPQFVKAGNILNTITGYDFVLDCTDNFSSKFLINDACVMAKIPFSHGGVMGYHGQTMTVIPGKSACYRCIFNEPPPAGTMPSASESGILGVIPGILGTIQATEAIKLVSGVGTPLTDALLTFSAQSMEFQKIKLKRQSRCPLCGENPSVIHLADSE